MTKFWILLNLKRFIYYFVCTVYSMCGISFCYNSNAYFGIRAPLRAPPCTYIKESQVCIRDGSAHPFPNGGYLKYYSVSRFTLSRFCVQATIIISLGKMIIGFIFVKSKCTTNTIKICFKQISGLAACRSRY